MVLRSNPNGRTAPSAPVRQQMRLRTVDVRGLNVPGSVTRRVTVTGSKKELSPAEARQCFLDVLSRARPKELAHDYLDREPTLSIESLEAAQQRAAEQWVKKTITRASMPGRTARVRTPRSASTARTSICSCDFRRPSLIPCNASLLRARTGTLPGATPPSRVV
jgi:hypothetical protein